MKDLRLGAHLRVDEDGLAYTVASARGMCFNELQIMTGRDRDYEPYEFSEDVINQFRKMTYEMKLTAHMPYVINPCEGAPSRKGFYMKSMKAHIQVAEALGAKRIVMHPGFKKELTELQAYENLLKFLAKVWPSETSMELLLENDSGSKNGSAIGSPEFIKEVASNAPMPVRMCLDTEHMYARGVDLWNKEVRDDFLAEYGELIALVHLNVPDHGVELGSFLDRHNTPFEERSWDHEDFIQTMSHYPLILERRSLVVIQKDNVYVRNVLGKPLVRQKA